MMLPGGVAVNSVQFEMESWTVAQRAFAVKSFYKNNDSYIAAQREFRKKFGIHRNSIQNPLHSSKVTVWCAVAAFAIIGPYFFEDERGNAYTVTSESYAHMLLDFFIPRVQGLPVSKTTYFQQDGATRHTAKITMNILRPIFPGHLISRYGDIECPARSPDLSVCDFYLWGHLTSVVYSAPSPRTTQELKLRIQEVISRISVDVFRAMSSVHDLLAECEQRNGGHLEDVIMFQDH